MLFRSFQFYMSAADLKKEDLSPGCRLRPSTAGAKPQAAGTSLAPKGRACVTDPHLDDPCIVFALPRESMIFRKEFRPQQRFPGAPCWARFCGPAWLTVLVMHAGIGTKRMAQIGEWLLGAPAFGNLAYRPKTVIMAGYAGGLREGLGIADVILATEICDAEGNVWPATWPERPLQGEWRPPLHRGRLLTVNQMIATPQEKRQFGERHDALAVDMESAVLARLCASRGVPFGCVRVLSDTVDMGLSPDLARLFAGEKLSITRVLLALLRRPSLTAEFRRLARYTRQASDNLAKALGELLTLTLPWSDEL
jgi:nucleoside phosphorylase